IREEPRRSAPSAAGGSAAVDVVGADFHCTTSLTTAPLSDCVRSPGSKDPGRCGQLRVQRFNHRTRTGQPRREWPDNGRTLPDTELSGCAEGPDRRPGGPGGPGGSAPIWAGTGLLEP